MSANDPRTPLRQGDRFTLNERVYEIVGIVGYGGSCLVYYAKREPNGYERRIDMPVLPAIIKEFYPLELAADISRRQNIMLSMRTQEIDLLKIFRAKFDKGIVEQTIFCINDSNHSLPIPEIAIQNGTTYIIVTLTKGKTLAECAAELSMLEKADVLTSLCNTVKKLHGNEKLYLDLKPSNIFVFEKEQNESRRVALFDFDTVINITDTNTAAISYSEGWSPYEQSNPQASEIFYTADIYAIGAVCYWLYCGKKVSNSILDEIVRGRFEFLDEVEDLFGNKRLKETIGQILSSTLKRLPEKRAQRVDDIPL